MTVTLIVYIVTCKMGQGDTVPFWVDLNVVLTR